MPIDEIDAPALQTSRLALEPLRVDHAEEMAPLLADAELYAFTGGTPPTLSELRVRYAGQVTGRSPDGLERWLNWIVRHREDGRAAGFVQAAISEDPPPVTAVLAWVLGLHFQGHGYAREAAEALAAWLGSVGVARLVAYIDDANEPSMGVARSLGMAATDARVDSEVVWVRITGSG
jgi:RimJ/RimL family protein N-acetyltransferase